MAWTSPKTWTVGEVLSAADMNTYVRDNSKALTADAKGTSASALATALGAHEGVVMRVRAGSSPYDFIDLVYDATLGMFVSTPEFHAPTDQANTTITQTDVTTATEASSSNRAVVTPWKAFVTAGLTPQIRLQCFLWTSDATKTANVQLALGGANAAGALSGLTAVAAGAITSTSTTDYWKDSGWATPTGHTDYDMETIGLQGWRASGGTGKSIYYSHIRIGVRWTYTP